MFQAYFDETGHSSSTEFVGMAGLIAPSDCWVTLKQQWRGALAEFKIEYFHMKEFAHSAGQFREWKWDEERRQKLFGQLFGVIEKSRAMPIGSIISMQDYRNLDYKVRKQLIDPYYQCLLDCCYGASVYCVGEPSEVKVEIIFDNAKEFTGRVPKMYKDIKEQMPFGSRLGSFEFAEMKTSPALQAADIVAYEYSKYCDDRIKRPGKVRYGFNELIRIGADLMGVPWFKYYDKNQLAVWEQELSKGESISL